MLFYVLYSHPVITDMINRSLQTSVFPSAWKISEVILLFKEEITKWQTTIDHHRYYQRLLKFVNEYSIKSTDLLYEQKEMSK